MDIMKELQDLQQEVNEAKEDKARAEGKVEQAMSELKTLTGLKSINKIKKQNITLGEELKTTEEEIVNEINEIKEEYQW